MDLGVNNLFINLCMTEHYGGVGWFTRPSGKTLVVWLLLLYPSLSIACWTETQVLAFNMQSWTTDKKPVMYFIMLIDGFFFVLISDRVHVIHDVV